MSCTNTGAKIGGKERTQDTEQRLTQLCTQSSAQCLYLISVDQSKRHGWLNDVKPCP